jgi:coenzyme F420-reducing hydrogenase gamma subunit
VHVPGCPPSAKTILFAIREVLEGRVAELKTGVRFG